MYRLYEKESIVKLRSTTAFYPKPCWKELCYKAVAVYMSLLMRKGTAAYAVWSPSNAHVQALNRTRDWSLSEASSTSLYELQHDKTNHPVKTQISLGIRPVWTESSLCAQWVAKDPRLLHADSEDSDQTGRMPRLICVFVGRTCHFVGFVMQWLILCEGTKKALARLHKCAGSP